MNQQASAANAAAMNARISSWVRPRTPTRLAAQQANLQTALSGAGGWDGGAADRRNAAANQQAANLKAHADAAELFMNGGQQSGCHAV